EAAPAQSQHPGAGRAGRVARLHHGRLGQRPLRKRRGPFAVPVDRAGAGGRHLADRASARPDHTAGAAAFPEDHRHGPARGRAAGGDCGRAARRPPATGAGRRRPADGIPRQGRRRDHGRAGRARQRTRLAGQPPVAAMSPPVKAAAPHAGLSVLDAVAVLVGVVIGIGIFGFPPLVAQHSSSPMMYIALWLAGGGVMLLGALCYAELGSAYPDSGGEYRYLSLAWGARTGLMFAWARCTVIQTGAIAAVAFIYGDYAQQLLDLGRYGAALHAALAVVALTALNIAGTQPTKRLQLVFTALTVTALAAMAVAGMLAGDAPARALGAAAPPAPGGVFGLVGMGMVYVLLTYGGWNESAYLSGELRDPARNMSRVLLIGTAVVTAVYLLTNLALLEIFGLDGLRQASAVGADVMRIAAVPYAAILLSLLV